MNAEISFYSKLYSRQRAESFFLENPNILKLSDELSLIFQLGKTPGNDGIPIEFYKIFWPLIGKFLIGSFNEAFDNKEMSPSQKQALITLVTPQNVIIAAKCNTNAKCNNNRPKM